eukprot:2195680-Rhodomonas_salina.1
MVTGEEHRVRSALRLLASALLGYAFASIRPTGLRVCSHPPYWATRLLASVLLGYAFARIRPTGLRVCSHPSYWATRLLGGARD